MSLHRRPRCFLLNVSPDGRDLLELLIQAELDDVAFQTRSNVRLAASRSHPVYLDEEDDAIAAVRYSARLGIMLQQLDDFSKETF